MSSEKKSDEKKQAAPRPMLGLGFFGLVPEVSREGGGEDERGGEGAPAGGGGKAVDAGGKGGGERPGEGAPATEPVITLGTLERLRKVFAPSDSSARAGDRSPVGKRGSTARKPPVEDEGGDDAGGSDE